MRTKGYLLALIFITVFVLIGWYEVSSWQECLKEHPWWYCFRILAPR